MNLRFHCTVQTQFLPPSLSPLSFCILQCFPGVVAEMPREQEEGGAQSVSSWYVISNMELLGQFMVGCVLCVS